MSLASLQPGGLYVILFIRDSPPPKDDFHWGLYLHKKTDDGGTKYHIKQQGAGWITDHGVTKGVFKSFLLVGLFQIATIPPESLSEVDRILKSYDTKVNNTPGITCRVWTMLVLEPLQKTANGKSLLKCANLKALEAEIMAFGNQNAQAAADNKQPRPLARSRLCGL